MHYAVTGTTGRSSARVIAIEEPTGASCSRPAAVTVFRRTVPTMAPAAENARHGEKRDGDSRDFGHRARRCQRRGPRASIRGDDPDVPSDGRGAAQRDGAE